MSPKPKKKTKKRKRAKKYINSNVNIENILLLDGRQVFLHEEVTDKSAKKICEQLILLDNLDSKKPIILSINSPGGVVTSGFAIVDTIKTVKAPVVTVVSGVAASMAGIISSVGYKRFITRNSWWMGHEMTCGTHDYVEKVIERTKFYERLWDQLIEHLKKHTKLTIKDLDKLRRGELWLDAEESKKKGVADFII